MLLTPLFAVLATTLTTALAAPTHVEPRDTTAPQVSCNPPWDISTITDYDFNKCHSLFTSPDIAFIQCRHDPAISSTSGHWCSSGSTFVMGKTLDNKAGSVNCIEVAVAMEAIKNQCGDLGGHVATMSDDNLIVHMQIGWL